MDDVWTAYQIDGLVFSFGSQLSAALSEITGKNDREINNKKSRLLAKWLDQPAQYAKPKAPKRKAS